MWPMMLPTVIPYRSEMLPLSLLLFNSLSTTGVYTSLFLNQSMPFSVLRTLECALPPS